MHSHSSTPSAAIQNFRYYEVNGKYVFASSGATHKATTEIELSQHLLNFMGVGFYNVLTTPGSIHVLLGTMRFNKRASTSSWACFQRRAPHFARPFWIINCLCAPIQLEDGLRKMPYLTIQLAQAVSRVLIIEQFLYLNKTVWLPLVYVVGQRGDELHKTPDVGLHMSSRRWKQTGKTVHFQGKHTSNVCLIAEISALAHNGRSNGLLSKSGAILFSPMGFGFPIAAKNETAIYLTQPVFESL